MLDADSAALMMDAVAHAAVVLARIGSHPRTALPLPAFTPHVEEILPVLYPPSYLIPLSQGRSRLGRNKAAARKVGRFNLRYLLRIP